MQAEPLVYIIVVNWNGGQVTLDCIDSLHSISYGNHVVVLVDNGSSDTVVHTLRSSYPQVRIIENGTNLRFAGGNNVGIRYALEQGARYVVLLNNDTTVAPDFLTHLIHRASGDPSIGMVSPKIYYHDRPSRIWFAGGEVSFWSGTMKHTGIRELDHGQYDIAHPTAYATGCCVAVRREAIEKAGMLDESFFIYTEDADWSMRIRQKGFQLYYEPEARIWHKLSVSTGGHLSFFKMRNKFLSNLRFFSRYAAWYHWFVFPWANIIVNGVAAVTMVMHRRRMAESDDRKPPEGWSGPER